MQQVNANGISKQHSEQTAVDLPERQGTRDNKQHN